MTISNTASADGLSGTISVNGTPAISYTAAGIILKPPASVTPANNGELMFQLTSNTSLAIKVRGSDGVVRSTTLTLA